MYKFKLLLALSFLIFCINLQAKEYSRTLCMEASFKCYVVKRGDSWEKLFPNAEQRDLIMRINRINISLYPGMHIAIPKDLSAHDNPLYYAPVDLQITPPGKKTIIVSLQKLTFGAYESDGRLVYWGPVSGGRGYCPDIHRSCRSPLGHFAVYNKEGFHCKSSKFPVGHGGAPMPYCMFFNGGFALHGSYEVPGYNASHGCIRLFVNDALWLNKNFTPADSPTAVIINP